MEERKNIKEYLESISKKIHSEDHPPHRILLHDLDGKEIVNTSWNVNFPASVIVEGVEEGTLTIKNQRFSDINLSQDYFKQRDAHGDSFENFFYERENNRFHPVKFVLENCVIDGFHAQSLSLRNERIEFKGNRVTGTVSKLYEEDEKQKRFFEENKMMDGIGFSNCTFKNQVIKGKKIEKLSSVTATEGLSFEDCEIKETDFNFKKCPLVQFLGKTKIQKITDIHKVNDSKYLSENDGVRDIYFSENMDVGDGGHTPEERQYFFKQIKLFQERRGDSVQALFAHEKYLQQEMKLKRLRREDKVVVWVSRIFGNGLSWTCPLVFVLVLYLLLSCVTTVEFFKDFQFLFPVFPHVFFDKAGSEEIKVTIDFLRDHDSLVFYIIGSLAFPLYYITLALSWYFLVKSLRKLTYKRK